VTAIAWSLVGLMAASLAVLSAALPASPAPAADRRAGPAQASHYGLA